MTMHIRSIETAVKRPGLDGGLLFDHHERAPLSRQLPGLNNP